MDCPEKSLEEGADIGKYATFECRDVLGVSQLRAWAPSWRDASNTPIVSDNLKQPSARHESRVLKDDSNRQARECRSESSLIRINKTNDNTVFDGRAIEIINLNRKDQVQTIFSSRNYFSRARKKKKKKKPSVFAPVLTWRRCLCPAGECNEPRRRRQKIPSSEQVFP